MKINIEIPKHATRFELDAKQGNVFVALTSDPAYNHIRIERRLDATHVAKDHTYLQQVVNEIGEALK